MEMVDMAAESANTLSFRACKELGVGEDFLTEWFDGVTLEGAEGLDPFYFEDYPNLKDNAKIAAAELDRLTSARKYSGTPKA